jgi:hypothetical protein
MNKLQCEICFQQLFALPDEYKDSKIKWYAGLGSTKELNI